MDESGSDFTTLPELFRPSPAAGSAPHREGLWRGLNTTPAFPQEALLHAAGSLQVQQLLAAIRRDLEFEIGDFCCLAANGCLHAHHLSADSLAPTCWIMLDLHPRIQPLPRLPGGKWCQNGYQARKIRGHRPPDFIHIDLILLVDQLVAHARDGSPWKVRVSSPELL